MWINTKTLVSISEVNKDLSSALKVISEYGSVVIMKNNMPVYIGVEADAFEKATLEKMPTITMREASRNFSSLVYKIYDNGYVMLTKRNAPICAIYSYELISRCKDLDMQYIKKEKL